MELIFVSFIPKSRSYIIPYFYITEYLLEFGYSEELSAYLISILGICQVLGMVALGWIGDQKWCNVTKTYAFCLFRKYDFNYATRTTDPCISTQQWVDSSIHYESCFVIQEILISFTVCGLAVCFVPFATSSYTLLIILYSLFGVTFASSFSFVSISKVFPCLISRVFNELFLNRRQL